MCSKSTELYPHVAIGVLVGCYIEPGLGELLSLETDR